MMTREQVLTEASRHCDVVWGFIVRIRQGDIEALAEADTYLGEVRAFAEPPGIYGVVMQLLERACGVSWETIRDTPLPVCSCLLIPGHTAPDLTARRIPNPQCAVHKRS